MIISQTLAELGRPRIEITGMYFDEVEIFSSSDYGASRKAHVDALIERAKDVVVIGAKFSFRPSHSAHPSSNRIIATVQGDIIKELP